MSLNEHAYSMILKCNTQMESDLIPISSVSEGTITTYAKLYSSLIFVLYILHVLYRVVTINQDKGKFMITFFSSIESPYVCLCVQREYSAI